MQRRDDYSQNFIRDPKTVKELIGHSNLKKTDTVFDLGAGSGVISSVLAGRVAKVFAIESEQKTAQILRRNLAEYYNVTVAEHDVMTFEFPNNEYKIFANIPFHLSTPLVKKLVYSSSPPEAIYLIVQKQFAEKLRSDGAHFTSQLGMNIAPIYSVRVRKKLNKTDFWPHPNVDTVLVELVKREKPLYDKKEYNRYQRFTTRCFESPTFYQSLDRSSAGLSGLDKPSRATFEQWMQLFKFNH